MKQYARVALVAAVLLLCGTGGWFLYRSGFFALTSAEELQNYISRFAPYSHLFFFLVQFLSVVLAPIPSNLSAAAGGMLFGTWPAFFLTFGAVAAGSLLVFWLARVLGRDFADRLVSRRLSKKYLDVIRSKTTVFLILAFLFPFFPDDVLCILAGLTELPFRRFVLIVLLTPPLGTALCQCSGRRGAVCAAMDHGAHWVGRTGSVPAGTALCRPAGAGGAEAAAGAQRC